MVCVSPGLHLKTVALPVLIICTVFPLVSEDTRSMDMSIQDNEDRGFYKETFHSSAWIYQGDEVVSGAIRPSLANRTRAVSSKTPCGDIAEDLAKQVTGIFLQ